MKVSCLQENFHKGLQTVGKAVANKTTLPVLNNILVSTDGGRLKLSATNLEVGITNWIGCQVEEEGAITVPARLLSDFVASLPADRITMTLDERTRQLDAPVDTPTKLIIPARSMIELARALPDDEGEEAEPVSVMVTPNRNQVLFHLSDLDVTSRLVEGNYVDIQRVIPSDWAT